MMRTFAMTSIAICLSASVAYADCSQLEAQHGTTLEALLDTEHYIAMNERAVTHMQKRRMTASVIILADDVRHRVHKSIAQREALIKILEEGFKEKCISEVTETGLEYRSRIKRYGKINENLRKAYP